MERRSSLAGTTEWRSTALFSIRDSSLARVKGRFNGTHKDSTQASTPEQLVEEIDARLRSIRVALLGIFLILLVGLVFFARDFLLPVVLALLLALTLSPIVRFMQKRGVAAPISALFIVLIVLGIFCAGNSF